MRYFSTRDFVQFGFFSILDFVQSEMFSIRDLVRSRFRPFGIWSKSGFSPFGILSNLGFCILGFCPIWGFVFRDFVRKRTEQANYGFGMVTWSATRSQREKPLWPSKKTRQLTALTGMKNFSQTPTR